MTRASLEDQVRTMACLINYARTARGLPKVRLSPKLLVAARLKADDIRRCQVFDHAPCGGSPTAVASRAGYAGAFGENLYLGEGHLGSPRDALRQWLSSRPHRTNVLSRRWQVHSVYVAHIGHLDGFVDATLWVAQFGDR